MKKLIVFCLILIGFAQANAQTEKGNFLLAAGTALDFSNQSFDSGGEDIQSIDLQGAGGYFVADHLAVTANIAHLWQKEGDFKQTINAIGPGVRYYIDGKFFLGTSFLFSSVKFGNFGNSSSLRFSTISFEAGYPFFLLDNFALEPSLNYSSSFGNGITNLRELSLSVGFTVFF